MTNRISRKSLALVAAGLLASPFVAQTVADAQTVTSPTISINAVNSGPVSAGVTGVNVTISCQGLLGASSTATATYTAAFGAVAVPTYWPLTPAVTPGSPTGSACTYAAVLAGTANLTAGSPSININVGGTSRATGLNSVTTALLPTFISTTVTVTVVFPNITVKKVVNGDEPVTGYAYPMSLACSNTTPSTPT